MTVGELKAKLAKLPDHLQVMYFDPGSATFNEADFSKRTWIALDADGCGCTATTRQAAERKLTKWAGDDMLDSSVEAFLIGSDPSGADEC